MAPELTSHFLPSPKGALHYLIAGPATGPLIIFIHGWPGLALTWRPQLQHFASLGYRVVAMDTLGYGKSLRPTTPISLYSCTSLAADQLLLLKHLNARSAIWAGHDWGCGPLWSLASHHPGVCLGIISLCVPYRTIELGVQQLISLSNRTLYPEDLYPHAQWDYMIAYEKMGPTITSQFTDASDRITKLMFSRANPANRDTPVLTSTVQARGGWFGKDAADVPDIPLAATVLDEELYGALRESLGREHGWTCATAYYLNHELNAQEHQLEKLAVKEGRLEMPILHLDARYDIVCSAETHPGLVREMGQRCRDLEIEVVEAGHWVNLEKADEVNGLVEAWLGRKGLLPGSTAEGEGEGAASAGGKL